MSVQNESVLESPIANGADLAGHDAALEPFVTTQGRGGLVSFPAPVANVFGVGVLGLLPPLSSVQLVRGVRGETQLAPQRVAVVQRLVYILRQQHRRQKS